MILLLVFITIVIIDTVLLGIMSRMITNKFDQLLTERNIPYPLNMDFFLPMKWGRANLYAAYILFFKTSTEAKMSARYRRHHKRYGNFCFRDNATKREIILSKIHIGLLILGSLVIFYLLYLGSR